MNKNIHNYVKKVLACHTQDLVLFLDYYLSPFIPSCFAFPFSSFFQHNIVFQSAYV